LSIFWKGVEPGTSMGGSGAFIRQSYRYVTSELLSDDFGSSAKRASTCLRSFSVFS
jgi:hypothetical protein